MKYICSKCGGNDSKGGLVKPNGDFICYDCSQESRKRFLCKCKKLLKKKQVDGGASA